MDAMRGASWTDLSPGAQLGNLEYPVDAADLAGYRALVGEGGHYPNLLADDCRALLRQRCGPLLPLTTLWRRLEFFRPPVPGRRVQVGGWLRETDDADAEGRSPRLRVAAFAVDEIGTEILRSEAVFGLAGAHSDRAGTHSDRAGAPAVGAGESAADIAAGGLAGVGPGDTLPLGTLILPAEAEAEATALIAGWLEAGLGCHFGDDFRWGGRLALAYPNPDGSYAGDALTATAVVTARDRRPDGSLAWRLAILARRQGKGRDAVVAVGDSAIAAPSPRRL